MKIILQNLGIIKQAEFELGNLTIICGKNNTGKTYATYTLFGFINFWKLSYTIPIDESVVDELFEKSKVVINLQKYINKRNDYLADASLEYSKSLPIVFAAKSQNFKDACVKSYLKDPEEIPLTPFKRNYGASKKQIFSMYKDIDTCELEVTLLIQDGLDEINRHAVRRAIGDAIQDILFGHLFPDVFIASAERTGAAIFRKELNFARNRLLEEVSSMQDEINPFKLINSAYSDYALPVRRNVDFTRKLEEISKHDSILNEKHPEILERFTDLIGGSYKVTNNDELYYIPKANKRLRLTMAESSSAIRSLLDIGFYLKHEAKPGDLLMIDEPELNLHPENQRRIARLLAQLVNIGIKVFITTHSDYIIKELNTLIMLNQESEAINKIRESEHYLKSETISPSEIIVYIADKQAVKLDGNKRKVNINTLIKADIDQEFGIEALSFDKTIDDMNRIQEALYFASEEGIE